MEHKLDLKEVINKINPSDCSYQEWVNIGMALKHEGYDMGVWDSWSAKDVARYNPGECEKKWNSFHDDTSSPITGATITKMAQDRGYYLSSEGYELDWNATIWRDEDDYKIIDTAWVEGKEIQEPSNDKWNPAQEIITYLETLFESTENVSYVTAVYENTDKKTGEIIYSPTSGNSDRTAGRLIEELNKCNGDIGSVLGDYKQEAGAWIRFNPVDGNGIKNENITDFRYALVESDKMEIDKQNAIMRELELPIAALVYSGGKSIHGIVRIDAANADEYRKRVDYLYKICNKNGLEVDIQNKNPSRLSRLPGVIRNGHKQFLIDTNIGKKSWVEWEEWIEGINDDLPDPESLEQFWQDMPKLAEPLIDGVLRQGHKMLIAGPSKAGKSFLLIELCIALAEGANWVGFDCQKGRVLYVNLELDKASCLHRFKDVYNALNLAPRNIQNIDIWNLRGKSVPLDKLAPKLIRRAQKKDYIAVVIDPIYKVITGDENSADQMAAFCNQFDKICTELKTAVVYCHHHSKGSQGNKRSMDRASGSGVFARDPDALLDLIELETTPELMESRVQNVARDVCLSFIKQRVANWDDELSYDDRCSASALREYCKEKFDKLDNGFIDTTINRKCALARQATAWRIEGTLREFPKFPPIDMWFEYPTHKTDTVGVLGDLSPEGEKAPWQKAMEKRKSPEAKKKERGSKLEIAYSSLELTGQKEITYQDLADEAEVSIKTIKNWLKENKNFSVEIGTDGKPSTISRK